MNKTYVTLAITSTHPQLQQDLLAAVRKAISKEKQPTVLVETKTEDTLVTTFLLNHENK